jgi:putative nucleotidyltransferase with HDIG domain
MEKTGLLPLLLPELAQCRGIEQKGFHRFDVLDHSLKACDAVPSDRTTVRLAALLHDLGKSQTVAIDENGNRTFHGHEEISARLAEKICLRFRYPNVTKNFVVHLIRNHMFHYEESWSDTAVRRFVVRIGEENLADAYTLRRADLFATAGTAMSEDVLAPLIDRVRNVLARTKVLSLKDLAVNGLDLSKAGIASSPRMGIILRELLETVLSDPEMNERTRLIEMALKLENQLQG